MPAFRDRTSWYLGLSAYWFATSYKWFILLQAIIPGQVAKLVPGGEKSAYWGAIFGAGALWAIVGPSIFGYLSDRVSRGGRPERRMFLAIGSGLTVIALFALSGAESIAGLAIGYLLLQLSDDVGTGPYGASIPELVPEDRRGRASATMGMLNSAGQIASILAALVLDDVKLIYIGIAAVNVLCAIWTISTLRGAEHLVPAGAAQPEKPSLTGFFRGWAQPWRSADFRWVWFTRLLNALGLYLVQPYLLYYIKDRVADANGKVPFFGMSFSPENATLYLALLISLTGIGGAMIASRVIDRLGRKRTIRRSGLWISLGLVPFALIPDYRVFVVIAIVFGVGYGVYLAADWALASDVMPSREDLAKDMGIWSSSVTSVQVLAGLFGSLIYFLNRSLEGLGYSTAFIIAAGAFYLSAHLVIKVRGST